MGAPVTPACLLLLLHLTAGTSAEPHYVVVSPAVLYHPHMGTVSVHLSDLNETVRVSVRLEGGMGPALSPCWRERSRSPVCTRTCASRFQPRLGGSRKWQSCTSRSGEMPCSSLSGRKCCCGRCSPGPLCRRTRPSTSQDRQYPEGYGEGFEPPGIDSAPVSSTRHSGAARDESCVGAAAEQGVSVCQDPNGNRIAQWRDVTPQQGIVDLSLPLSAEPALGTYAIEAQGTRHSFSVEEYVLPKFKVTLELPPVVTVLDETLLLQVCGRYTYGKPVLGRVHARLCREEKPADPCDYLHAKRTGALCTELTGQTESNGCFSTEVGTAPFNLTHSGYKMSLQANASLVEEGTGVELSATKNCDIVSEIATVTFEDTDETYKTGIPYTGKMLLKTADGSALKNEKLQLFVRYGNKNKKQTFLTDESGRASFELNTSGWTGSVTLRGRFKQVDGSSLNGRVSPSYQDAHRHLEPFYSKSQSFLKIRSLGGVLPCDQAQQLQVDYVIAREALGNGSRSLDFIFLVVAKGAIARILHKGLDLREGAGLKGSFSVELPVGADLVPAATVLGYTVLPDGEMAADSAWLHVAKCLPNKVKLAFSQDRALPGSELQLRVQAAPGSLCAIRAVDQSVLLMKPEAELSVDTVYNLLLNFFREDYFGPVPVLQPCSHPSLALDLDFRALSVTYIELPQRQSRGTSSWTPPRHDAYSLFKVGLDLARPHTPL
nr:alpha-2-macroglobulin-like protein 1 [Chrysemys picta bellii]